MQHAKALINEILCGLKKQQSEVMNHLNVRQESISVNTLVALYLKTDPDRDPHFIRSIADTHGLGDSGYINLPSSTVTTLHAIRSYNLGRVDTMGREELFRLASLYDLGNDFSSACAAYLHGVVDKRSYARLSQVGYGVADGKLLGVITPLVGIFQQQVADLNEVYQSIGIGMKLDLLKNSPYLERIKEIPWVTLA